MTEPLQGELATFRRELPGLLSGGKGGRFALIHGDRVDSLWDTDGDAYEAGCQRFGLEPFLVMLVAENEPPVRLLPHPAARCRPS
jgi:hypothetical protein